MKMLLKTISIIAAVLVSIAVLLFSGALIMQDRVAEIILKSLNKEIATRFEFESLRLSFLRKFPKASLDLRNVLVHSSPGFDRSAFSDIDTDTLLAAKSVFIEFDITDIYHGIYDIERISIRDGMLRLLSDTAGMVNYEISKGAGETSDTAITIDLRRISLERMRAYYNNLAIKLLLEGSVEDGHLKSRISGDEVDFNSAAKMQIKRIGLYNTMVSSPLTAYLDLSLSSNDSLISFRKGTLGIDDYLFTLTGSFSSDEITGLVITGRNLDLNAIRKYLPVKIADMIAGYDPAGILNVSSTINGPLSRTTYPDIAVEFSLDNGSVSLPGKTININGISLEGSFSNRSRQLSSSGILILHEFNAVMGSAPYSGSLTVRDFDTLAFLLELKAKIVPTELKEFFNIRDISSSAGSADLDLKLDGVLPAGRRPELRDLTDFNPEAIVDFSNFTIGIRDDQLLIEKVTGKLILSDSLIADNLKFGWRGHRFMVAGIFHKLPEWLAGKPVIMNARASISSDRFVPAILLPSSSGIKPAGNEKKAFILPDDIIFDLDYTTDSMRSGNFRTGNIKTALSYKPGLVNFKSLDIKALDGNISGNGFIHQETDRSFTSRATFSLEHINISSAFRSFNNFGQDFIIAENINGSLTGSLSVLIPADSLWKVNVRTLSAEGKYVIDDGGLIDFEPVMELSSFIELSELKNIRFERLENEFFIRNNYLYIPQMDVRSSAVDLSVNGKHSFENQYEYHIKMLLSEILSKKFKKTKAPSAEFGAVQDDGLGRTSVLLKIESRGEDVKVSYDMKAAGNKIKDDIRAERKTLRNILNEEYGWFKDDTVVTGKPSPQDTPRFRIVWDEADTVQVEAPDPEQEKPAVNPLKNLLKKKKE